MSESYDYEPASWTRATHSTFANARVAYDQHVRTSYATAQAAQKRLSDLLEPELVTESTNPWLIITDQTGSMGEAPKTLFAKYPYIEHEAQTEYLGPDAELAVLAFGDGRHSNEQYWLQARPFARGAAAVQRITELVIEQGGGGGGFETSEAAMLYLARKVRTPRAIRKPIAIFLTDEKPYPEVDPGNARAFGVELTAPFSTKDVVVELKRKFAVYCIKFPYCLPDPRTYLAGLRQGELMTADDREFWRVWANLLGEDHVPFLVDPQRVADTMFGILAQETGKVPYFYRELSERQMKDADGEQKVEIVRRSLTTVHRLDEEPKQLRSGKSRLHAPDDKDLA